MSTYGASGSLTYSVSYSSLDAMMNAIKDNTSGAIQAQQLRNSVLTLWDKVSGASASAETIIYTSNTASTITVGGLTAGTNFSGGLNLQQMFETMFHPYVAPTITTLGLSTTLNGTYVNKLYLENGSNLFNSIYIKWLISQGSVNLIGNPGIGTSNISINGTPFFRYNGVQPGYINLLATQSGVITIASQSNVNEVITLSVVDGVNTTTATCSVTFLNKFYWGNFTPNPASYAWASSDIQNLNGASVSLTGIDGNTGNGNILTNTKTQTLNGINGAGKWLVFAFPTTFGTPTFIANGLLTTAFSVTSSVYTNINSVTQSYSIWYSNTIQNSPINYFQIN
jgi:hypothetical protein